MRRGTSGRGNGEVGLGGRSMGSVAARFIWLGGDFLALALENFELGVFGGDIEVFSIISWASNIIDSVIAAGDASPFSNGASAAVGGGLYHSKHSSHVPYTSEEVCILTPFSVASFLTNLSNQRTVSLALTFSASLPRFKASNASRTALGTVILAVPSAT